MWLGFDSSTPDSTISFYVMIVLTQSIIGLCLSLWPSLIYMVHHFTWAGTVVMVGLGSVTCLIVMLLYRRNSHISIYRFKSIFWLYGIM